MELQELGRRLAVEFKSICGTEIKVSSDFLSMMTGGFGQNEQRKVVKVVGG